MERLRSNGQASQLRKHLILRLIRSLPLVSPLLGYLR